MQSIQLIPRFQILLNEDEKLSENVTKIMSPDFHVVEAHVTPTGMCEGGHTEVRPPKPNNVAPPSDNILLLFTTSEEYFSIIIPVLIILVMILIAGLLACLLYRRRPSTKLRIGEDERQSFRSRGIPVIFQVRNKNDNYSFIHHNFYTYSYYKIKKVPSLIFNS